MNSFLVCRSTVQNFTKNDCIRNIAYIRQSMSMEDINLSCIANDVVNGHSFQFAAYDSTSKFTSKNWHSQQLFTFDIDNLKPTSSMDIYILIDELSKLHLRPALVYSTYGNADREELTRFRMMFV